MVVDKAKKADLELLITLGKKMGMSISIAPKKKAIIAKKSVAPKPDMKKRRAIASKINKAATKRMLEARGWDYEAMKKESEDAKFVKELSKKINRSIHKKYIKPILDDYDNRQ